MAPSGGSRAPDSSRSLLVVTRALSGGGVQRVTNTLLRCLSRERFRPSLAVFDRAGPFPADVPADVPVHDLGRQDPHGILGPAFRLRRVVHATRPSVVLTLGRHASLRGLAFVRVLSARVPVVISLHSPPAASLRTSRHPRVLRLLYRHLYPHARRIIAASAGIKGDLESQLGIPGDLIRVIHNPCEIEHVERLAIEDPDVPVEWGIPTLVAAGRLTEQKGFADLLRAVARVPGCQLLILGEGKDRPALTGLAAELGISERVVLPGFRPNPFAYMARARAFVLSSLWEGLPLVLLEAMACGAPVVSTDCHSGPGEIITHGINGLLVPPADPVAMADALTRVLTDPELRARLALAARQRARDFAAPAMVAAYEEVLTEIARASERGAAP